MAHEQTKAAKWFYEESFNAREQKAEEPAKKDNLEPVEQWDGQRFVARWVEIAK